MLNIINLSRIYPPMGGASQFGGVVGWQGWVGIAPQFSVQGVDHILLPRVDVLQFPMGDGLAEYRPVILMRRGFQALGGAIDPAAPNIRWKESYITTTDNYVSTPGGSITATRVRKTTNTYTFEQDADAENAWSGWGWKLDSNEEVLSDTRKSGQSYLLVGFGEPGYQEPVFTGVEQALCSDMEAWSTAWEAEFSQPDKIGGSGSEFIEHTAINIEGGTGSFGRRIYLFAIQANKTGFTRIVNGAEEKGYKYVIGKIQPPPPDEGVVTQRIAYPEESERGPADFADDFGPHIGDLDAAIEAAPWVRSGMYGTTFSLALGNALTDFAQVVDRLPERQQIRVRIPNLRRRIRCEYAVVRRTDDGSGQIGEEVVQSGLLESPPDEHKGLTNEATFRSEDFPAYSADYEAMAEPPTGERYSYTWAITELEMEIGEDEWESVSGHVVEFRQRRRQMPLSFWDFTASPPKAYKRANIQFGPLADPDKYGKVELTARDDVPWPRQVEIDLINSEIFRWSAPLQSVEIEAATRLRPNHRTFRSFAPIYPNLQPQPLLTAADQRMEPVGETGLWSTPVQIEVLDVDDLAEDRYALILSEYTPPQIR